VVGSRFHASVANASACALRFARLATIAANVNNIVGDSVRPTRTDAISVRSTKVGILGSSGAMERSGCITLSIVRASASGACGF
jgi:hypothetical protein